jgi:hypothetical protein
MPPTDAVISSLSFSWPRIQNPPGSYDKKEVYLLALVRWFTREEILQMVLANGIVDNLSLSPILLALLQDTLG